MSLTAQAGTPGLGYREELLVQLAASGKTPAEIAVAFRCSAATYYRLAGRPLVRARVAELRTLSYRPALDQLMAELPRNIAVLQAIQNDVTANDSSRIRAVEALTNMALRFADIVDLMGRVASLEAMAERPAAGDGYSDESDADESDD